MAKGKGKGREGAEGALKCGGVCGAIVLLLTIILVSASFSKLEYYEYGFAKRVTTSTVDRSKVYEASAVYLRHRNSYRGCCCASVDRVAVVTMLWAARSLFHVLCL